MFLKWLSRFTDQTEQALYKFLHEAPTLPPALARQRARFYLQQDAARLTLLLEWKFKGYRHLKRGYRRACYHHLELLEADFRQSLDPQKPYTQTEYLAAIAAYLNSERVTYSAGSSFDKLCRDPQNQKLVGDCNQLVTLYVYLFAQRFSVSELQLKLLPEHVCLHYEGKDYEATTGQVTRYKKFTRLAPVSELIAVNLLDVADKAGRHQLPPANLLLCAQLALAFTSDKAVARHNIKAAQQAFFNQALENKNWRQARQMADQLKDKKRLRLAFEAEGFAAVAAKSWTKARRIFNKAGSKRGVKAVDQAELSVLIETLSRYKTLKEFRSHRTMIRRALTLAKKRDRDKVKRWCEDILRQL